MKLTRYTARYAFTDADLTTHILPDQNLRTLIKRINLRMQVYGLSEDTYRMRRVRSLRVIAGSKVAELRCHSRYFDNREAVTFNFNGFIGWANDRNIAPIL